MAKPKTSALRTQLVSFALSLPGAFEDHPWGETVAKVGKKVFAFFGVGESGDFGMSVKLPQSGSVALGLPFVEPTGYGLGKSGWVSVKFPKSAALPAAMFEEWILESYRAIAPKTLVKQLDAAEAGAVVPAKAKKAAPAKKVAAAKKATAAKKAAPAKAKKPAAAKTKKR